MVWWNYPARTCNIKIYDPPYVLLHRSQLQIIHTVMKCAALNWQIHKSAATGQEARRANSLASHVSASGCKALKWLTHTHLGRRRLSEGGFIGASKTGWNSSDYVHVNSAPVGRQTMGGRLEQKTFAKKKKKKFPWMKSFLTYPCNTWDYYVRQKGLNQTLWVLHVFTYTHSLSERHCSKAMLGIWIECNKFCQSKYGLINELAS